MTRNGKLLLAAFVLLVGPTIAVATNDTIGVTAGAGKTANLINFASTRVISETGICDATTENQCAGVNGSGQVAIQAPPTLPLPTGAATSALQTTGNTSLTTINTTLGTPFQAGGSIGNTTFAATQSGTWNVTNISGTVSLPTGASTAALQPTNAAQGSTTSGQTGPLVQCATTTAAPTYTTAQTDPLSCDTAGNLRVNVTTATGLAQGSTTSGQTGSMIMGAVTATAPTYTTAQTAYASLDVKGNQRVVLGGGTPITASATGTTTATTATLATSASVTTYICGFSIRANATGVATNNATVTGTITGTLNFTQWTAPLASGLGVTEETFTPCISASAANQSIAVVSGAPGAGGVVSVSAWGYQQ